MQGKIIQNLTRNSLENKNSHQEPQEKQRSPTKKFRGDFIRKITKIKPMGVRPGRPWWSSSRRGRDLEKRSNRENLEKRSSREKLKFTKPPSCNLNSLVLTITTKKNLLQYWKQDACRKVLTFLIQFVTEMLVEQTPNGCDTFAMISQIGRAHV